MLVVVCCCQAEDGIFFFQAEGGIRDLVRSRGLGDVYKSLSRRNVWGHQVEARSSVLSGCTPVPYTHLTLPMTYSVQTSAVVVSLKKKIVTVTINTKYTNMHTLILLHSLFYLITYSTHSTDNRTHDSIQ